MAAVPKTPPRTLKTGRYMVARDLMGMWGQIIPAGRILVAEYSPFTDGPLWLRDGWTWQIEECLSSSWVAFYLVWVDYDVFTVGEVQTVARAAD